MQTDDQKDKDRAAIAMFLKNMKENWPMQLDLIAIKARLARARYLALRAEGFTFDESLRLCLEDVKL